MDKDHSIDFVAAWVACKQSGHPEQEFKTRVVEAIQPYKRDLQKKTHTPSKIRTAIFNRLRANSKKMLEELQGLPEDVFWELGDMYFGNEPADFDKTVIGTEYEGLSPFEYEFDMLGKILRRLNENLHDTETIHKRTANRPKQNAGLENSIQALAEIFESYTGQSAKYGLSYDSYSAASDYRGDFMPLLRAVFWSYSGRQFPQEGALGEVARKTFGLK